jgi:hypothetical protein
MRLFKYSLTAFALLAYQPASANIFDDIGKGFEEAGDQIKKGFDEGVGAVEKGINEIKDKLDQIQKLQREVCSGIEKVTPIADHIKDVAGVLSSIEGKPVFQEIVRVLGVGDLETHINNTVGIANKLVPLLDNINNFCRDADSHNPAVVKDVFNIIPKICPDLREVQKARAEMDYFRDLFDKLTKTPTFQGVINAVKQVKPDLASKIDTAEKIAGKFSDISRQIDGYMQYVDKGAGVCSTLHL